MKKFIAVAIALCIFAGGALYLWFEQNTHRTSSIPRKADQSLVTPSTGTADLPLIKPIATNLDTPWSIGRLPNGWLVVTERNGRVSKIDPQIEEEPIQLGQLSSAVEIGEGGLLGLAVHPSFSQNGYVYFYYTYRESGRNTVNRVVRMTLIDDSLQDEKTIVDAIPGASNHNGGRIVFGPDNLLYIGTGDAQEPSEAQDTQSLAGKILRVTDTGDPASDNPFGNAVYSYGHRNVQGLAFDSEGNLWATEHGRSGALSGFDEINLIQPGGNYGWPTIQGDETMQGMISPIRHSGATTTWAPAGATVIGSSLFFAGLRGATLYEAVLNGGTIIDFKEHFVGEYGRLRDALSVGNMLYMTTSNLDGRGKPTENDDQILRVNVEKL